MLEPAASIIEKIGGPTRVAKIVGVHRTRVCAWKRPRAKGGTDGRVPQDHHAKLLTYARAQGIPLSADEFVAKETS